MKKGFTLIELLAVIIILAVIALIATPVVLNIVDEARLNAAKSSAYGYIDAVKLSFTEGMLDETLKPNVPEDGILELGEDNEQLNKIKVSGTTPEYIYLKIQNNYVESASFCINGYNIEYKNNEMLESETDYCKFAEVKNLQIITEETTIYPGDTLKIEYNIEPSDIKPIFTSSDESVATIDENGLVTPVKEGEVTITLKAGLLSKNLKLNVSAVKELGLVTEDTTIYKQLTLQIEYNIQPSNVKPVFTSSDESIAIVDENGLVTPVKEGEVTITLSIGNLSKELKLTILGESTIKCVRAKKLHTEECINYQWAGCVEAGYTTTGSQGTTTIKYGNENVTEGVLTSGDAFDCDVDGDGLYGEYDSTTGKYTERFYYITDLESNSNYAVLLYYTNTFGATANAINAVAYNSKNLNYNGPVTAIEKLPTIEEWKNISLYKTTRAIVNEDGEAITTGGTLPSAFSYVNSAGVPLAARLVTYHEIAKACTKDGDPTSSGKLNNCAYIMDNLSFTDPDYKQGYWLETPVSYNSQYVWDMNSYYRRIDHQHHASQVSYNGVRPAIEVLKLEMDY